MILKEVSKYLQEHEQEIVDNKTSAIKLISQWIRNILHKPAVTNVEKILHCELLLAENRSGEFAILGKSASGRVLMESLNNFAIYYENYLMSKWLADKKPHHFKNYTDDKN